MDDHHKLQEGRPPKNAVVPEVKAGYFKHKHLLMLVVTHFERYLQVDAPDGSGLLSWDDPIKGVMYRAKLC
jgi:hypothetical protein